MRHLAASFIVLASLTTARADPQCPDFVRGAKLEVANIDGGVRITIHTARPDNVRPLRTVTRSVAELVEQRELTNTTRMSEEADGAPQFPPMAITIDDVRGGVSITIKATEGTDVAELRDQAHQLRELWRESTCINGTPDA
jgi:hypothetical protein